MKLTLYGHPFSSYCQKVLIALYANQTPFTFRVLGPGDPDVATELAALWPLKRFPVLLDHGRGVSESSVIIEHLMRCHPGPVRLIPEDPEAALEARLMDRFFDSYVMTPMSKLVSNQLRPDGQRDPYGVAEAKTMLDTAYGWLDGVMAKRTWAAGDSFSLADCAAAPALFYADWAHRIGEAFPHVRSYRSRLLARPSFARAVDEARPFRPFFPLGAPDRD
jgi:glutathione S-transferase